MKVIFLDIDGVLNSFSCKTFINKHYFVMDEKIQLLKQLVDETEAKIVLSSSWRMGWVDHENNEDSIDREDYLALIEKLKEFDIELYDYTPINVPHVKTRGEEIDMWLKKHDDVQSFVILDDMYNSNFKPHTAKLIQTSMEKGLLPKHIKKAKQILNIVSN